MTGGRVVVVGVGADGPAGLGEAALRAVAEAEVLVGGRRLLAGFPDHPAERIVVGADVEEAVAAAARAAREGRRVAVVASGDPLFHGIGAAVVEAVGPEAVEVIPHVSSVQLAFARLRLPWDDAALVSVHARPLAELLPAVRTRPKVAVLTGGRHTPGAVAAFLLAQGLRGWRAWVCENLGSPGERVVGCALEELPGREFAPLNVLVLLDPARLPGDGLRRGAAAGDAGPRAAGDSPEGGAGVGAPPGGGRWPVLGLPDGAFEQRRPLRGLITRQEVRLVSLARLELPPAGVLWDVGAGTGSVAIEAARLAPGLRIFAVERNPDDAERAGRNASRFGAEGVAVVLGEAPAALAWLPDPDRVFIGGTGGRLAEVLEAVAARLRPGGRIVLNAVTLETLAAAEAELGRLGWERDVTLVNVARARRLGTGGAGGGTTDGVDYAGHAAPDGADRAGRTGAAGGRRLTRLEPLEPVFVLAAWREGER